jgi:hypothetical protein
LSIFKENIMSQGNASAAIGLANTNKIAAIGGYLQDTDVPGPSAEGYYAGINSLGIWDYNPVNETDFSAVGGFTVPSNSGAATGKVARLVSTDVAAMTVAADGKCNVTAAGVVTALVTTGLYKTFVTAGTVIPAGRYIWVFLV